MEFIDLKSQFKSCEKAIRDRIDGVLAHGRFIMGPEVQTLESALAEFVGVKHCIGVASGTDALMLALMACNVGPGDEVVTSPFSFFATAEVILLLGAKPVFVDIDPKTFNLDPTQLEASITPNTKAIIPVSLYGQCADFDAINDIAANRQIPVIEDGAQSLGATYHGRQSGGLSTIGTTSFFPSKPLGCYGDGGACFTDDDHLANELRALRIHGQFKRYEHERVGVNARLDTLQAAILLAKLPLFPDEIVKRHAVADQYAKYLRFVETPYLAPQQTHVYGQYTIRTRHRAQLQQALKASDIPTSVHYPIAMHQQPALNSLSHLSFPHAEQAASEVLSLPMHPYMQEKDVKTIAEIIEHTLQSESVTS